MDDGNSMTSALDINELTELQSLQTRYVDVIQSLRKDISKRVTEYNDLKKKFDRLKTDFLYNLQLLRERDAELGANEKVFHEHNIKICQKEKDISDLKVKIDELMISNGNEAKAREELQLHYQQRIREKQAELEEYRSAKDAEVAQERNGLEAYRRNLERQVKEMEGELEIQRRELTSDFDEAAKKREHEFRAQLDQMSNTVLSHELKVKLLTKELELARAARETSGEEVKQVEDAQRDLEKRLKRTEWELEETRAIKDAKLTDLEEKLSQYEQRYKRQEEEFIRKYAELDQTLKRKDMELAKASETGSNRERHLLGDIQNLTEILEESSIKLRQLEWNLEDAVKEKSNITEKLEAEIAEIKVRWEQHVTEISRDSVTRDVHLNALREAEEGLKDELIRRKQDIERYKKDLAESLQRLSTAERAREQVELDWERRCEDLERLSYQRSEDLLKNLTKAKAEALATVEQQKLEMDQMEQMMRLLQKERDQALATLARHGLKADRQIEVPVRDESSSEDVVNLVQQNQRLQAIIKQMKEDMESLMKTPPERLDTCDHNADSSKDYVKNLEGELSVLKSKCRQLELKVHDLETFHSTGQPTSNTLDQTPIHNNASVNAHLEQLNNMISMLRREKMELTAQLRKMQTAAIHLQGRIDQLSKQPMEKQVQMDQLQYELNASKRRSETEALSLRQRIADLELQVTEARKEADEYYRASTECNAEVNALSNQVSQLKLELATANPAINFGAQELVIQQLEDVITNRITGGVDGISQATSGGGDQESVGVYRARLKMAVKDLMKIAQKNKLLTEINNRLLAEMARNGMRPSSITKNPGVVESGKVLIPGMSSTDKHQQVSSNVNKVMQSKLQQLEELQYHITKQELAIKGQAKVQDADEDFQPQSILKNSPARQDVSPRPRKSQSQPENSPKGSSPRHFRDSPKGGVSRELQKSLVSESSLGGESLKEIWQLIDENRSPTLRMGRGERDPGSPSNSRPGSTDSWTVTGSRPQIVQRQNSATNKRKSLSAKAAGRAKPLHRGRPNVTNYNNLHGSRDSIR